ncbi:MAG: peptide deformylase [Planctomycetota bacterium]|jgi:peptide deformylase|nr:peptide deformylase [Planctomycetota bacterium]
MEVVLWPDPVLRRGVEPVEDPTSLAETARQMLDLMYRTEGVGLAAPQVGLTISLLVLNPSGDPERPEEELVLINPKIVSKKGKEFAQEGCLSFPEIYGDVQRAQRIVVTATDADDNETELRAEDFLARVIQHEMDHLKGVVFIDRFTPADRIRIRAQLEELEERYRKLNAPT